MTAPITKPAAIARIRELLSAALDRELRAEHDAAALRELFPERYDSLAVLDAVGAVETEFGIEIDLVNDDLRRTFSSVATISELVTRKQRDRAVLDEAF
jgi:acyl carrier protein